MGLRRALTGVASTGILLGLTLGAALPALAAGKGTVVEYAGPETAPLGEPSGITVAPDGSLWFAQTHNNKIGRITTDGVITQFSLPAASCTGLPFDLGCEPTGIAADKNGDIWFTEADANRIGRFHPATTTFTEYPLPQGSISPGGIALGSDKRIWFTFEQAVGSRGGIGAIDPADAGSAADPKITEYDMLASDSPMTSEPSAITAGESGVLWFAGGETIGKITTAGVITEYSTIVDGETTPDRGGEFKGITAGPSGSVFFTEYNDGDGANRVWARTSDGAFHAKLIGNNNNELTGITLGPDGNIWFAENDVDKIGTINLTTGALTEYGTDNGISAKSDPVGIVTGPDGNIWFTESSDIGKIGRLFVAPAVVTGISPACEAGGTAVTITGTGLGGVTEVKFGDKVATNVSVNTSGTKITATIPAGTGTVKVVVTTPFGPSAAFDYTYTPKPAITGLSPSGGPVTGGTDVTISGSGFASGNQVKFGDTAATNITVSSDGKTIHATSPAGSAAGTVNVVVTGTCGASNAAAFSYIAVLPATGGGHSAPMAWLLLMLGAIMAITGIVAARTLRPE
jgi:virginiamycin B lyase